MLGTFNGALSPGVFYIGNRLISKIPISVKSKYYYFKISFRMLYNFTENLKTNPNIVSSLDLNFTSNIKIIISINMPRHDNQHMNMISAYEGSILLPSIIWWYIQCFTFFNLDDSWLNHRNTWAFRRLFITVTKILRITWHGGAGSRSQIGFLRFCPDSSTYAAFSCYVSAHSCC